ncbi:hypothetical protein ACJIZ3_024176 [Penstemon smallii]|uniref:Uncharacterized protein n=1 Tax=Penstemon smallii TaxID=265156 RepID=A0ABD3TR94_9LAMI
MSWIRSAVNKAVETGGNSNLSRAVRSYADTVVQQAGQAVVGGAKLLQDRLGARNFQSCKLAVKRLEEVSVSCKGIERIQLLRRWLVALKEIERLNEAVNTENLDTSNEPKDSPTKPSVVLYYDPDLGGEPMNFRDVFLLSQALEGITLSLILEEPKEEEFSLLLEIFRVCLMGGKEAHDVTMNCVRDLAKAFSTYNEEVLAKREELLQYVQDAIAGLKDNAEIERIDSEVSNIHKKLDKIKNQLPLSEGNKISSEAAASGMSTESLKEALECIRLCSRLEELLLRKKLIKTEDCTTSHNQKVDKLKLLSESLASSASKTEKRISENRTQKEEALKFRVAKTSEVSQLEKDLAVEIEALQKRKDELEAELKKVTTTMISAQARLHDAKEERDQFDEASNQIVQDFNLKEDELSKSIASYRAEAEICNTFVNFLEHTWGFQSYYAEQKEKLANDELERHEDFFVNLAISLLAAYKEELGPSISSFRELVVNLKGLDDRAVIEEKNDAVNTRRSLEEQYQSAETKFLTTFSIVESIKKQMSAQQEKCTRKDDGKVKDLIGALEKIKEEFESFERPTLQIETPTAREETPSQPWTPPITIPFLSPRQPPNDKVLKPNIESTSSDAEQTGLALSFSPMIVIGKKSSDAEVQFSKLKLELELENHIRGSSMEGISDWEFDDKIDKEPKKSP